jgi:hypothetical protein
MTVIRFTPRESQSATGASEHPTLERGSPLWWLGRNLYWATRDWEDEPSLAAYDELGRLYCSL